MTTLRIGTVSFLNARPLTEGLADIVADVPSGLTRRFNDGTVDVALLPVLEALRRPDCPVVGSGAIASPGPVDSVLLLSRDEPAKSGRVLLDASSRTSNGLARILFAEAYGTRPEFITPGEVPGQEEPHCRVLIGDPALTEDKSGLVVTDLATSWRSMTGLPFCFAVWVARDADTAKRVRPILSAARKRGLAKREEYARDGAARLGLPVELLRAYLFERIHYSLGAGEREAVKEFGRLLRKHRLL